MSQDPWPMTDALRDRFDALVDEVMEHLPIGIHQLLDEISIVVLDEPDGAMLKSMGIDPRDPNAAHEAKDEFCGLHTGTALIDRSVEAPDLPDQIHLFRRGIVNLAGGWDAHTETDDEGHYEVGGDEAIAEEIHITLLHEIGHHFGLDEDDLANLGYD
jgi:predicted Zn-dependent protease with MMP-like domain